MASEGGGGGRSPGCAGWAVIGYLAFAGYAWWDFARTNHDGLANIGLYMLTAPVALLDLALSGGNGSVLTPSGHGYLGDHALYYAPAVVVTAVLIWLTAKGLRRLMRGNKPPRTPDAS